MINIDMLHDSPHVTMRHTEWLYVKSEFLVPQYSNI